MGTLTNSTYLDFTSWHSYSNPSLAFPQVAYGWDSGNIFTPAASQTVNVALVLPRAHEAAALLESNWATRQQIIADLNANGTLWQTYGAQQSAYDNLISQLQGMGIAILGQGGDGYVTSQESRTVWVSLNATQFNTVFGTPLLGWGRSPTDIDTFFWNNSLTVQDGFGVTGLWFDMNAGLAVQNQNSSFYNPAFGPQSIGNAATAFSAFIRSRSRRSTISRWPAARW